MEILPIIQPYLNQFGIPFVIVLVAVSLDIVFGIACAIVNNEVSSSKMREGIGHKLGIIGTMLVAMFLEGCCSFIDLGFDVPVVGVTAAYLTLMEAWSVCEILVKLNPELSGVPIFSLLKTQVDKETEDKA